jgi:hypothetical protein
MASGIVIVFKGLSFSCFGCPRIALALGVCYTNDIIDAEIIDVELNNKRTILFVDGLVVQLKRCIPPYMILTIIHNTEEFLLQL